MLPDTWVYERVLGALVRRHAPSNTIAHVLTRCCAANGASCTSADGTFALTTPLPTGYTGVGFATLPAAAFLSGTGAPREFSIPERAVRDGATVWVNAPTVP